MATILAYDLGASSGRALIGRLTNNKIITEELHRFPNDPVQVGKRLHWDILRLYHELKQALLKAKHSGITLSSLGIDSWAVDFGLLGADGELLGNPYHYRDPHTNGMMERLLADIPATDLFARTGIQFLPFNTIFQLYALKQANSPLLQMADRLLMIPDLLRYFLTGEHIHEFTNATTTQLYNPTIGDWDRNLLEKVGIKSSLFGTVVQPGMKIGQLRTSLCAELGIQSVPVVAVAEHDTGSAVVAVPAITRSFAFLSCGTWSLIGTELNNPIMTEKARELNFTNEGGAYGTYRLLKNIMGLWLLQECQREWEREGTYYSHSDLIKLAETAPALAVFIDPDHPSFLLPGDMPARIRDYCRNTGQKPPEQPAAMIRCILESLALKYRYVLQVTEQLSAQSFKGLHMVGGGIHNSLLCQWTANSLGKPVWAGPAEGSAIGNLAVQWISNGDFVDLQEARRVIRESFPITVYEPEQSSAWEDAYGRFARITQLT